LFFFSGPYASDAPVPDPFAIVSSIGFFTAVISFLGLIVSAVGVYSSVRLGWRADRRQSEEFKLKIEQLELQLAEAREKASEVVKNSD
jgi:hypothetical protein